MSERDKLLAGLREQAGGIDPAIDQAQGYTRAVRAVQRVMHEQGQVMSAALDNNHLLYHTNKKLVARCRELDAELASLRRRFDILSAQNTAQAEYIAKLEAGGGDRFRPLYEDARRTLVSFLHDELTQEQLRARLGDMEAQRKEIDAMPERVTDSDLKEMEVIPMTPDEIRASERTNG